MVGPVEMVCIAPLRWPFLSDTGVLTALPSFVSLDSNAKGGKREEKPPSPLRPTLSGLRAPRAPIGPLFVCSHFGSDPILRKILTSHDVRGNVTSDVTTTTGIEPVDSLQTRKAMSL
jgi:hypothetical protein